MNIIGITGKAGAGKDAVADILVQIAGRYKYSFATPLKNMLMQIGINPHIDKETVIPEFGVSPRQMMQTLGTEWGRQLVHPDFWVILAKRRYDFAGPGMVAADVRFENEAEWIRANGVMVHVHRNEVPRIHDHISEGGIAAVRGDIHVYNNGSLANLETTVRSISWRPAQKLGSSNPSIVC